MRVLVWMLLLCWSAPLAAQSPAPPPSDGPFLPDAPPPAPVTPPALAPPPPTTPPPSVTPDPGNAGSWDDYGKDEDVLGAPAKKKPDGETRATTGALAWREIPWALAAQAGGITFGFLVLWQCLSIPLGILVPCAGSVFGLVGVLLPIVGPLVGLAWATEYRGIRAPLISSLLSGLVWLVTGLACLPPVLLFSVTPLMPVAVISLFLVQSAAVSVANAVMLVKFGRLRIPGEKVWNMDILNTPQPGADDIESSGDEGKPRKKK